MDLALAGAALLGLTIAAATALLEGAPGTRTLVSGTLACAAAALWQLRRTRRVDPGRRSSANLTHALQQHELAVEWNEVRRALTIPGSTIERLVESSLPRPEHRWLGIDARTGEVSARNVGPDVEPNSWIVLDRQGAILAIAAPSAPDAWLAAVRRAARLPTSPATGG